MKCVLVLILCLFVLKVGGRVGTSQWKNTGHNGVQFRSGAFSSASNLHRPLDPVHAAQLILCAGRCLSQDNCIGILAAEERITCETLTKISTREGMVWKRQSGNRTPIREKAAVNNSPRNIDGKRTIALSARTLRNEWYQDGKYGATKILRYSRQEGTKELLTRIQASGHPRQWVTGYLGGVFQGIRILILSRPSYLCTGLQFTDMQCMRLHTRWTTLQGTPFDVNYLYGYIDNSIKRIRLPATQGRKSEPQMVLSKVEKPLEIAIDSHNGYSIIFWSDKMYQGIYRAQSAPSKQFKRMDPLTCNRSPMQFHFTINSAGDEVYMLSFSKTLSLFKNIRAPTNTGPVDEKPIVCRVSLLQGSLLFHWPTIYVIRKDLEGANFRTAFKKLSEIICIFANAAHLALTATATPQAIKELAADLQVSDFKTIKINPDRVNIFLEIQTRLPNIRKQEKLDNLIQPLAEDLCDRRAEFPLTVVYINNDEALGYCYQYVARHLKEKAYIPKESPIPENRIFAQYHKAYTDEMKTHIVSELRKDEPKIRLILATVALGMGLNAPSIRREIHVQPPTTLEKYFQEIGRAGRDGKKSSALLFYNKNDIAKNREDMSEAMIKYCTNHILVSIQSCFRITKLIVALTAGQLRQECEICDYIT